MGLYKISRASAFLGQEEHEIEFVDTPGYDKNDKRWYKPLKKIITECHNMTYQRKREKKRDLSGNCGKAEYDFNVWDNKRSTWFCFS